MKQLLPSYYFDLEHYAHASLFHDVKRVWEVLKTLKGYLESASLGKIEVDLPSGVYLANPETISIAKGTVVEPGSYIQGPCWIGENNVIRHGAYIRGFCITGNGCVIGHDTEMKNTILLNHAHAAHFAYLGDSIVGNYVNLGAGTKCANLKLSGDEVILKLEEQEIATGLRKFGAVIGDGSQTGCNTVTNPGTLMGKNCLSYPCVNFGGFIPSESVVKLRSKPMVVPKTKD